MTDVKTHSVSDTVTTNMDMDVVDDPEIKGLDEDITEEEEDKFALVLKDGSEFPVKKKLMEISNVFKTATSEDPNIEKYPASLLDRDTMEAMFPYLEHHKGIQGKIIPFENLSKDIHQVLKHLPGGDVWDATYVDGLFKRDKTLFYKVMTAANYLDIRCLVHLTTCYVGINIKGEPWEKIREFVLPDAASTEQKSSK